MRSVGTGEQDECRGEDPDVPKKTLAPAIGVGVVGLVLLALAGRGIVEGGSAGATGMPGANPSAASGVGSATSGSALTTAERLTVKGRAPMTGYARSRFGDGWIDTDHNGCDTRNDILARDLTQLTHRPGTHDCIVTSGTLVDPYTGTTIHFVRGQTTSEAVQIDHVVALGDAWQKGAQQWTPDRRVAFANDPLELLAVSGPANQQKGDGDTATWLPPNTAFRCAYVARQVAVKQKYALWVTAAEKQAMIRVLSSCPGQPLPKGASR